MLVEAGRFVSHPELPPFWRIGGRPERSTVLARLAFVDLDDERILAARLVAEVVVAPRLRQAAAQCAVWVFVDTAGGGPGTRPETIGTDLTVIEAIGGYVSEVLGCSRSTADKGFALVVETMHLHEITSAEAHACGVKLRPIEENQRRGHLYVLTGVQRRAMASAFAELQSLATWRGPFGRASKSRGHGALGEAIEVAVRHQPRPGRTVSACCPFHSDRDPSFIVGTEIASCTVCHQVAVVRRVGSASVEIRAILRSVDTVGSSVALREKEHNGINRHVRAPRTLTPTPPETTKPTRRKRKDAWPHPTARGFPVSTRLNPAETTISKVASSIDRSILVAEQRSAGPRATAKAYEYERAVYEGRVPAKDVRDRSVQRPCVNLSELVPVEWGDAVRVRRLHGNGMRLRLRRPEDTGPSDGRLPSKWEAVASEWIPVDVDHVDQMGLALDPESTRRAIERVIANVPWLTGESLLIQTGSDGNYIALLKTKRAFEPRAFFARDGWWGTKVRALIADVAAAVGVGGVADEAVLRARRWIRKPHWRVEEDGSAFRCCLVYANTKRVKFNLEVA